MNPESRAEELAELSYLWASGEWKLQCCHWHRWRVIFVFPGGRPSLRELQAVRAVMPGYAELPVTRLKIEMGDAPELVVGEFENLEARRLRDAATKRGLNVRMEDCSETSYLPVRDGSALIIEDDELASMVVDEMQRRGVLVVGHIEAD